MASTYRYSKREFTIFNNPTYQQNINDLLIFRLFVQENAEVFRLTRESLNLINSKPDKP